MAKQVRNASLDTPTARSKLKVRPSPYWAKIGGTGHHLGYKRVSGGFGYWHARWGSTERIQERLGVADDILPANGTTVLDWPQAQQKARTFFDQCARGTNKVASLTVRQALVDYFRYRKLNSPKDIKPDLDYANARIIPQLGDVEVRKLTRAEIQDWLNELAVAPRRKRKTKDGQQQFHDAPVTDEERRARKASANRTWAVLRAALNLAADKHDGLSTEAWARIKPFKRVSKSRVRFLDDSLGEPRRLINACEPDLRDLVRAALLTGARYGELCQVRREDFSPNARTLFVSSMVSKTRKERHIHLSAEGVQFFVQQCWGLEAGALIFTKANGEPWGPAHQHARFADACKAAGIALKRGEGFHITRHTYASHLVKKGVPLKAIAEQLGHTTTAMVERHYGHLAPSVVAEMVQQAMGTMGIVEPSNVLGVYDKQPA